MEKLFPIVQILRSYCIIFLMVLFLFCTFNTGNNASLIMKQVGEATDTVSIWPQLIFVFSVPLKDNSVNLKITPDPGPVYSNYLSETKDTLTISVTGMLEGNTRYIITLEDVITAENGSKLYPDDAVFDIITLPKEREPNNSFNNTDTLLSVCFGTVSPASDTDYFYINNTIASTMYLKNHDKKSGFFIVNTSGSIIAIDDSFDEIKTFSISDSILLPLFVGVFSLFGNDTRYEIGLVP